MVCFVSGVMSAQNILSVVGNFIEIQGSGVEHIFMFDNLSSAEIQTSLPSDWYKYENADSTLFQSGTTYLYPEHNTGYILHTGTERTTFWVLDYSQLKPTLSALTAQDDFDDHCSSTLLNLIADIPDITYQTVDGRIKTIDREGYVTYTSLSWNGEQWNDSTCIDTIDVKKSMIVGAPLKNTTFTLHVDAFARQLGINVDSIESPLYQAVAVEAHPTSLTTVRGTEQENIKSNEIDRPTEVTQLSGSAPLDILFTANANAPVAQYYNWRIYKGSELIVQRSDQEHRYTFEDYGTYRVILEVSNDYCKADSQQIDVSVSLSQLRVPNVFTPNGDGHNDEFRVSYSSIIEFECWIYNRWGMLVYHFTDPAKGWDGNINGRPAAEGAYYYVIRAKGADAEAGAKYHKATKKRPAQTGVYQLSGDINLIRGGK